MNIKRRKITTPAEANERKLLRILCAEDEPHLAQMLQLALERAGYLVEWADDGQKALERIKSESETFDLLVTDHRMPRLSGLQLVEQLRDFGFSGKIVVHSSQLHEVDARSYHGLAVDHIFTKPVQLAELLRVIQQVVGATP